MADATNRKLDVENTDEDRISRDDPLFELSQIIGYSERDDAGGVKPDGDEGQMDLEDALMRELGDFSDVAEEGLTDAVVEYDAAVEAEADAGPVGETVDEFAASEPEITEKPADYEPISYVEPEPADDSVPDTLEAELMDLLGGLGDKAGTEWPSEAPVEEQPAPAIEAELEAPAAVEEEYPVAAEEEFFESEARLAATEAHDESSPQVPATAPVWYDQDEQEEEVHAAPGSDGDSEILDAFESALSENLALSFEDEASAAAESSAEDFDEADDAVEPLEFNLDFEESVEESTEYETETSYSTDHVESTYLSEVEAVADEMSAQAAPQTPPVLDTADLPASDMEAMQPLDLPDLPEVEETGSAAVDIERELDAALTGYDNYTSGHENEEPDMRAAATAAAAADTRLDFDMGAFEDDLARDLEFVGHDMEAREGESQDGAEGVREAAAVAGADFRKPKRGMMIAAAVGGIAILGAIGAFSLTSRDGGEAGAPVLVKADSEPTKVVPEDPGGKEVPNQDRAVYGEVDGNGEAAPTQETLVSTSEEPIDLGGTGETVMPNGMTETAKVEDRLTPEMAETTVPASSDSGTAVLAPRRVRTVIVKPDGTLVENEPEAPAAPAMPAPEPVETAAATEEPVRRIDMATSAPQAEETQAEPAAEASTPAEEVAPTAEQTEPEAATAEQLAAIAEPEVAETPETVAETQPDTVVREPLRAPTAIPERPADQPVTIVGGEQPAGRQVASAPAAPQATAPAPAAAQQSVPAGAYTVQIASQPSAELAQKTAADLSRVYANLIGNRTVAIQQAEIEGRGTYHRVRIVANSRQDAVALCDRIKQEGGSCFVAR